MRFRSYLDGSERFMAPETSMEIQADAGLRHRARVRRVHAVPRRARVHRALDRAHAPLAATAAWTGTHEHGPRRPARLRHRPGRRLRGPARRVRAGGRRAARATASRSAARWAPTRPQMYEVVGWATGGARPRATRPRHLLGIGEIDDLVARRRAGHRHVRLRDADAARAPRHGARPRPRAAAGASTSPRRAGPRLRRAAHGGLPVPGLRDRLDPRLPALPGPRTAS